MSRHKARKRDEVRVVVHGALARYLRELHHTGLFGTTHRDTVERVLSRGVEVCLPLVERHPPREDGVLGFATGRKPA